MYSGEFPNVSTQRPELIRV